MAETIASSTHKSSIITQGEKDVIALYTEIFNVKTGVTPVQANIMTQQGETAPDIDARAATEAVLGVLLGYANEADIKASFSLGVTIAADKLVKVLRPTGGRVKVQMILHRTTTVTGEIEIGEPLYASQTAGVKVSSVKGVPTGSTHLAPLLFMGRSATNVSATLTTDKLVEVWF